jgi:hypothetical protein
MRQLVAAVLAASAVIGLVSAQTYRPPRTAWGDPDLEGRWPGTGASAIPLQRPESFGTRNALTDAEFAERAAQLERQKVKTSPTSTSSTRASPSARSVGDSRRRSIGSNGRRRSARHR